MKKDDLMVMLAGKKYGLIINRKNIKHTYIRVNEQSRIVVNTDFFTDIKEIKQLVNKNKNKIIRLLELRKNPEPSNKITYLGNVYKLNFVPKRGFSYEISADQIVFYTEKSISEIRDVFYKREALMLLPKRLNVCFKYFLNFHKISFPNLIIRKMKKRFGTCYYSQNKICLNSYLIRYSQEIIDYVIYHELCHFIHRNHGADFYSLLGRIVPDYRELKKSLN